VPSAINFSIISLKGHGFNYPVVINYVTSFPSNLRKTVDEIHTLNTRNSAYHRHDTQSHAVTEITSARARTNTYTQACKHTHTHTPPPQTARFKTTYYQQNAFICGYVKERRV